jgi:Rrf2 family cysteine metabolism transcriptional repressor
MRFSSQVKSGLRAALELALREGDGPTSVRELASVSAVSEHYLEQVLSLLRRADLVRATRGAAGGYALARPAAEISLRQLLEALDGLPAQEAEGTADAAGRVLSRALNRAARALAQAVEGETLAGLAQEVRDGRAHMYYI